MVIPGVQNHLFQRPLAIYDKLQYRYWQILPRPVLVYSDIYRNFPKFVTAALTASNLLVVVH
jgi:hypothetical protein